MARRPWRRGPAVPAALYAAALLAVPVLALPTPVAAAEEESADALAAEAIDKMLRALDALIGSIPQYETPYINENGDIIIRRKREGDEALPTPDQKPPRPDAPDTTTT